MHLTLTLTRSPDAVHRLLTVLSRHYFRFILKLTYISDEWGQIHIVLLGHRSIVNQVRFNRQSNIIASSGVEKMVKVSFQQVK